MNSITVYTGSFRVHTPRSLTIFLWSNLFIISASLRKSIFSSTVLPTFNVFTATATFSSLNLITSYIFQHLSPILFHRKMLRHHIQFQTHPLKASCWWQLDFLVSPTHPMRVQKLVWVGPMLSFCLQLILAIFIQYKQQCALNYITTIVLILKTILWAKTIYFAAMEKGVRGKKKYPSF